MINILTSTQTILSPQFDQQVHDLLSNLLSLVLLGLSSMIAMGVKLWISSQKTGWKKEIATRAVKYVEQKMTDQNSDEKYRKAAAIINEHFPRLSTDEIEHLIEAAVHDLATQTATQSPASTTSSTDDATKAKP